MIKKIIERYGNSASEEIFHLSVTNRGKGNHKKAIDYLNKYFMDEKTYSNIWKPIQKNIFQNESSGLPLPLFRDDFSLLAIQGGVLFEKNDFEYLQNCIKNIGDKNIVIIQNDFGGRIEEPLLRMIYPSDITWEELINGDFISIALFEIPHNEYLVFSESCKWGKYSANDYDYPVDIIGFNPIYSHIFKEQYKQTDNEKIVISTNKCNFK
jgi:hypothetical protein